MTTSYSLVRTSRLNLHSFAARAGMHPELVRRLVTLGLLEPTRDATGRLWFTAPDLRTAARIQRLRAGLGLNYAAIGVVVELLDRVADLERQLRTRTGGRPWT